LCVLAVLYDRQTDRQDMTWTDRQTDSNKYSTVQYSTVQYSTVQYSTDMTMTG